jgi:3-deoxy-manno-octulosonate cytidylyltransferase (CMP-KDO synthetase)
MNNQSVLNEGSEQKQLSVVCIIPARLKAQRFPGKMLTSIAGKPLLQWAWEAASTVACFEKVIFAIDAPEIAILIEQFGGRYVMTSEQCTGGTERLVEVMKSAKISADIWVNWQGDEPFITKDMVAHLLQSCENDAADVWTLKKRITDSTQIINPNIAKVVCDNRGFALYFSRSMMPFYRDVDSACLDANKHLFYKHVGLYAFTSNALQKIALMNTSYLEDAEKLEQLRWLQYGLSVRVHETDGDVRGIDTPQDLEYAEKYATIRKACSLC